MPQGLGLHLFHPDHFSLLINFTDSKGNLNAYFFVFISQNDIWFILCKIFKKER